jgi:hydroxymethylpyrimidine pyrophosphatase-like HAD family hydrolase/adenine/guanine phosphoribosyltransferase-like PRPP-binding protein
MRDVEQVFFEGYSWCLNPYPTVREAVEHLNEELRKPGKLSESWQIAEVLTNVYLLSCALINAADDYIRGKVIHLPNRVLALPFVRFIRWSLEKLGGLLRLRRRTRVLRWRENWQQAFERFLALFIAEESPDPKALADIGNQLTELLRTPFPADLQAEHIYFPSAFRKHDLAHFDVLTLGRRFVAQFPDRGRPILILGLRSAGSWFAPVLQAFLREEGYQTVESMTVRPDKGAGGAERSQLKRCLRGGYLAAIIDDSPRTGDTIVQAVDLARKIGFATDRIAVLVPVHPATRDWRKQNEALYLHDLTIVSLEAEDWYKVRLLDSPAVESQLRTLFPERHVPKVCVVASGEADQCNARLQAPSEEPRRTRLKRVYAVRLQYSDGEEETRHVLAKSVGWGWLGYHAYLAGQRLDGFVPPVLGLRDGILFSEWLPQSTPVTPGDQDRVQRIGTVASYIAARARTLGLGKNPLPGLGRGLHHDSLQLLDRVLSRAYGGALPANMMRPRLRKRLACHPCPFPILLDGKLEGAEWIAGPSGLLKTDYEHHGMGKNELNLVDPSYDLAESILRLELTPVEERRLLERYVEDSGDGSVEQRLFLNKLLAGIWTTALALKYLFHQPSLVGRQQEFHQQFLSAWHFLTVHTARFCGKHCHPPKIPCWRSPLVVLDIDGVLDRRIFGFPSTTAAGIEALSLLHDHAFSIAVDTARSAVEVQEYCRAYGFAGGVAEYGSYAWDAVNSCGRVLLSAEALDQLTKAREALQRLPGVFLDHRHQYSIRAFTYEDRPSNRSLLAHALGSPPESPYDGKFPVPLPTLTVNQLLGSLGLTELCVRQTSIDTTIIARDVDKGTGLQDLLKLIGQSEMETLAVGDTEPDLPMFRVASRCFAPAHIGCARLARSLGCQIARHSFQRGLLDIARSIVHSHVGKCRPSQPVPFASDSEELFFELLRVADRRPSLVLLCTLLDPRGYRVFFR